MPRLHPLVLTQSADVAVHNAGLTERSSMSADSPLHRSLRCGPSPKSNATHPDENVGDVLTGNEKKAIEKMFYHAGPLATSSAAEALLASFGWTLTDEEHFQWFPEEERQSITGEASSRHRPPVTLGEVLELMRMKKIQFLALAEDKENESLATFVALGGRFDGTGTADISTLVEAVQQLRGDSRRKKFAPLRRATTQILGARAFALDNSPAHSDDEENDDENDPIHSMEPSMSHDYMLSTQLRTMPRILRFPEFVDALQLLRNAACSGGVASPQRTLMQMTNPGTPSDADLQPLPLPSQRLGSVGLAAVGLRPSMSSSHQPPQFGQPVRGSGALQPGLGSVPTLRASLDDEWSDGDPAAQDGGSHSEDDVPSPCNALFQSIHACVNAFHARRAPESTLEKIVTLPPSQLTPMSGEGTTWSEILASRKFKARKTNPVTPLMMIREKAQQDILAMESAAIVEQQIKQKLSRAAKPIARVRTQQACRDTAPTQSRRHMSEHSSCDDDGVNTFVDKLARHIDYLKKKEESSAHKTKKGIPPSEREVQRPSSACVVRPATKTARRNAPALAHRWRKGTAGKLVEARERALELALAQQSCAPLEDFLAKPETNALQPPVAGFENRKSPFLAYPQVGVYRRPPSAGRKTALQ